MLQQFLNQQLITTSEDANFEKLKKASAELVKKIGKNQAKISNICLVAIDPDIPATNELIVETQQLIIDSWSTFIANTKDTAVTTIRAVMLDALDTLAKGDNDIANLIWLTTRNVIRYHKLGREKEILQQMFSGIARMVQEANNEEWQFQHTEAIELPEIPPSLIEKADVETLLKAATTHTAWGAGGENPEVPTTGNSEWSTFFATKTAKGLSDIINKAQKKQVAEIIANQQQFLSLHQLVQIRTQLLWWKESAFSPSTGASYRLVSDGVLQLLLAHDASIIIPTHYPESTNYFISNFHNSLSASAQKNIPVKEYLALLAGNLSEAKKIADSGQLQPGRIKFSDYVHGYVTGVFTKEQFDELVGFSSDTKLSLGEITIWLFHDNIVNLICRNK